MIPGDTEPIWIFSAYILAGLVGYGGYRAKALSASGAVAACVIGGIIFGFGGLPWAFVLIAFFASSSLLSFFKTSDSRKIRASETFEKGGRRDAAQVLANGSVATVLAALSILMGGATLPYLFAGFVGALAAATADTWATEIGVLSKARPRMLTSWKMVNAGTSGAVTLTGIGAAFAGAMFLGIVGAAAVLLQGEITHSGQALVLAALAGGMGGSMLDSLLGATLQASYRCPQCEKATESRIHSCGATAQLMKGIPIINNDVVNFAATLTGALLGALVYSAALSSAL
ncbi:MAG: DUF92 domain-containing protein [Chloroflexia bacterium]